MTDDESDVDAMDILTRREVLSGGSLALLGAMGLSGTAAAQTGTEPRIQLGSDWEIDDFDDGSGNNNLRIRHQPSGAELVYNVTENQWEVPNLSTEGAVTADEIVIGGTIYEEDDNSPVDVTAASHTYTMADPASRVIIIPQTTNGEIGGNEMRVNGDTGANYRYVDNDSVQTSGVTEWLIPRQYRYSYLELMSGQSGQMALNVAEGGGFLGLTVHGDNVSTGGPVTQFTFLDSGGSSVSMTFRVYRREMNI